MGLHRHAVERLLRTFQSLPLRAESRVTQTRWRIRSIGAGPTPVFKAAAKTSVIPRGASRARPSSHARTRTAWRTGALAGALPRAPGTGSGRRGLALLARTVIAPARYHRRPRCGWWYRRRCDDFGFGFGFHFGGCLGNIAWDQVRRRRKPVHGVRFGQIRSRCSGICGFCRIWLSRWRNRCEGGGLRQLRAGGLFCGAGV